MASIKTLNNFKLYNNNDDYAINFRRKIIILGNMAETGIFNDFLNLKLKDDLVSSDFDIIIFIGKNIMNLFENIKNSNKECLYFENIDILLENKNKIFQKKDLILIKGANSLKLWRFIEEF